MLSFSYWAPPPPPCTRLLSRTLAPPAAAAAGIPAGLLRQQERQILADLGWDLMTLAREVSRAMDGCNTAAARERSRHPRCPARPGPLPLCPLHSVVAPNPRSRAPGAAAVPARQPGLPPHLLLACLPLPAPTPVLQAGAVALPDPTDAGCLDQQQQLAALAAPLITNCKPEAPPARAAMLAGPQARPQPLAQPLVCNNLLAQPEEHDDCFPAMPGGSHMQGCLGRVPTSGLAALGW